MSRSAADDETKESTQQLEVTYLLDEARMSHRIIFMLSAENRVPNVAAEWRNVDLLLSMESAAI